MTGTGKYIRPMLHVQVAKGTQAIHSSDWIIFSANNIVHYDMT